MKLYHVFSWATQSVVRITSDRDEAERVALTVAVNTGRTTEIREDPDGSERSTQQHP